LPALPKDEQVAIRQAWHSATVPFYHGAMLELPRVWSLQKRLSNRLLQRIVRAIMHCSLPQFPWM
jgi:hypothetical protein